MKINRVFSVAMMVAMCFSSFSFAFVPDEGMFVPGQIAGIGAELKKKGLKIKPSDIYNPGGGGLTDAVVRLDSGCSAEFVSPDGLILTNHHCAFDALVSASKPNYDLVEDGFDAKSRSGEIQAKGSDGDPFSLTMTQRIDDVTAKVKAGTENLSGKELADAIKKNIADLTAAEKAKANGSEILIQGISNGYFYYLYQTAKIKDIRVVYAPPRNIGVFGGDPDNFEWTRHTGDFAFLRAYVGPDGSATDYSPNNVPYKPKKFFTMNIGGLKENDFVFVIGFPGGTTRYRESQSIEYARDATRPFDANWLRTQADVLRQIGSTDEEKRIKFQSDIASFDNTRKSYEGGHIRLQRANVVQQRQAEEAKMAAWIAANPDAQKKYGTLLADLKSLSEETYATSKRDAIIRRFPDPISGAVTGGIVTAATAAKQGKKLDDKQKAAITAAFSKREPVQEREMLKFFMKSFDALPANQRFAAYDQKFAGTSGRTRRDAEAAFAAEAAESDKATLETVLATENMSWPEIQAKHPFLAGVVEERAAFAARSAKFNSNIDRLRQLYIQALKEMRGTETMYPDANFTMRFTYGHIKGYSPREAEYRTPFTTMKGMIAKDTGEKPFDAPQGLIDLQNRKDFGRYGEGDSVIVNFLSTTDIVGGNSGSPILNANGEQVGICFDGNFEGLGNDFYYDYDTNRTISVDIRYVLFVTEKFSGAKWVVDEMKVVGRK
ncbi:MAG: S46 family peptidase [Pyrinomonadaceae bacterium]